MTWILGGAVVELAAGHEHTCAIMASGGVRCWGEARFGRLGYGSELDIGDDEAPASAGDVQLGAGIVVGIVAGAQHTCVLMDDGAVRCWGRANIGQLGYGNTDDIGDDEYPESAGDVLLGGPALRLAVGSNHTCALLDSGTVRCWGDAQDGQLGHGNSNIGDTESPSAWPTIDMGGPDQLAGSNTHTCAVLDDGGVRCWGLAGYGQLGYPNTPFGNLGDNETPAQAGDIPVGVAAVQVSSGESHTCVTTDIGTVRCWGAGESGQLGYVSTASVGATNAPADVGDVDVGEAVVEVSCGYRFTCALLTGGTVRCWGSGQNGVLGYPGQGLGCGCPSAAACCLGDNEPPWWLGDVDLGESVTHVGVGGGSHSCALLETGGVRCWGEGAFGQLGYANIANIGDDETPASAGDVELGGIAVELSVGGAHNCVVMDTGGVRCWGSNTYGQLGYGNTNNIGDNETPASAGDVDLGGTAVQVAAGAEHTCAILDTGTVRCWGRGVWGQLGYGNVLSIGDNESPASAGDVDIGGIAVAIEAAGGRSCAVLATGDAICWGYNPWGALGQGQGVFANIGDNETPASAGDVPI